MATIYAKTADGQNEIETRARRITPRARSLLILIDGKRHDEELAKLVQQFDETLALLLEGGLVEAVGTTSSRSASKAAAAPAEEAPAAPAPAQINGDLETVRRESVRLRRGARCAGSGYFFGEAPPGARVRTPAHRRRPDLGRPGLYLYPVRASPPGGRTQRSACSARAAPTAKSSCNSCRPVDGRSRSRMGPRRRGST